MSENEGLLQKFVKVLLPGFKPTPAESKQGILPARGAAAVERAKRLGIDPNSDKQTFASDAPKGPTLASDGNSIGDHRWKPGDPEGLKAPNGKRYQG